MEAQKVCLSVPTEPSYARSVRMLAANLAVVAALSVDDVEDVRMAAEEGFVYACTAGATSCSISFELANNSFGMNFALQGSSAAAANDHLESLDLAELLLSAVCDEYHVSEDGSELHVVKRMALNNGE